MSRDLLDSYIVKVAWTPLYLTYLIHLCFIHNHKKVMRQNIDKDFEKEVPTWEFARIFNFLAPQPYPYTYLFTLFLHSR